MKILIIGQYGRKGPGFAAMLTEHGHRVHQVSVGNFGVAKKMVAHVVRGLGSFTVSHLNPGELSRFLRSEANRYDVIFAYGDHGHPTWKELIACSDLLQDARVVVGLHNHLCSLGANPTALLKVADGLIFLSEDSRDFYTQHLPALASKPVIYIPSLYLPRASQFPHQVRQHARSEKELSVAMGGRWVTARNRLPGSTHVPRYDFIEAARLLSQSVSRVTIYGWRASVQSAAKSLMEAGQQPCKPTRDPLVFEAYEQLRARNGSVQNYDYVRGFERHLSRHHFMLNKGILSELEMDDPFENMNYQLRYTSSVVAGVPVLVGKGTDAILERQVRQHGFGKVFNNPQDLADPNFISEALHQVWKSGAQKLLAARRMNSLDTYATELNALLNDTNTR